MKIGIITVPFNNNYGGFLQAYALKTTLIGMGHKVIFVNRRRDKDTSVKGRIRDFLYKMTGIARKKEKTIKRISVNTNLFIEKYLYPITAEFYSSEELNICNKMDIDCFIVGSDQVWRYKYAQKSISDFFLGFVDDNVPRFSYAASFGTNEIEYPLPEIKKCSELLSKFFNVSVRERSSILMLDKVFGFKGAKAVLDPTLLLHVSDYKKLFEDLTPPNKPYILSYILDESGSLRNEIKKISNNNSIDIIDIKAQTGKMSKMAVIEPIEKWLMLISYANIVITDSFHGTVFSILFNRPFVTIGNKTRGLMRFGDLLSQFGLLSRLVFEPDSIENVVFSNIDWTTINTSLDRMRNFSLNYLQSSIMACEKIAH